MPHLNALHASKAEAGLVVVGVTGESAEEVEAYVKKNNVEHPIGVGGSAEYDVTGIPDAFLIDKDGKIVWRGHPAVLDENLVDRLLMFAKPAVVAKGLEGVHKLRKANDHGGAWKLAHELLDGGQLSERAQAQAKEWIAAMEMFVADQMAEAAKPEVAKDSFLLWKCVEPLASGYQGVPGAEPAKARLEALMADGKAKKEIEGGRMFEQAAALEAAMEFDKAWDVYRTINAKFGSTRVGKTAGEALRGLEKANKLGYRADCPYCKAAGNACPTHRPKKKR